MTPDVQAALEAEMDRLVKQHEAASERAVGLMARDPALGYIQALVIAGDLVGADHAIALMQAGELSFERAYRRAGSYGRFEVIYAALDGGYVDVPRVADMLPDEWSGSDPDDTDPRALALWRAAWEWNGLNLVEQDAPYEPLPPGDTLRVYRGQDITIGRPTFGIAWSLDRKVAEAFAIGRATRQSDRWGVVYAADVRRDRILGWVPNRHEAEVIIDPADLIAPALDYAPTPRGLPR